MCTDFGESHYIGPILPAGNQPLSTAWVDDFPHQAFLTGLIQYYVSPTHFHSFPLVPSTRIPTRFDVPHRSPPSKPVPTQQSPPIKSTSGPVPILPSPPPLPPPLPNPLDGNTPMTISTLSFSLNHPRRSF